MAIQEDYWVYVLRNATGRFYVGITADISKRLEQHTTIGSPNGPSEIDRGLLSGRRGQ